MDNIFQLKDVFTFAMHGAGAYAGCVHSNSKEAFLFWLEKGVKIFEIDVGVDAQYEEGIAFAHVLGRDVDWLQKEINPSFVKPDYKANRLFPKSTKGLSIMLLSELFQYMKEDPELLIMFDFYGGDNGLNCSKMMQIIIKEVGDDVKLWERFLIEVYTSDMIQLVKSMAPNANMIFGESDFYRKMTVAEVMSYGVSFVSFPRNLAEKDIPKFEEYVKSGFTVFSFSFSNYGCEKWMKLGVNVNIVDIKYDNCFQLLKHVVQSILPKINVVMTSINYMGFKEVIKRFKNIIFK